MASLSLQKVVHRLGRSSAPAGDETDACLLGRFVQTRDEAAFERLVRRHGPLVLGVCRRLLGHEQDAEDAFQATFLSLAREARRVTAESLAGWLYRVAFRIAVKLRRTRPLPLLPSDDVLPARELAPEAEMNELRATLDEEVNRLPAKYRLAFVLCCLHGRSNGEAAREIDCPRGTIDSRLAWAKRRLRQRLLQRGVAPLVAAAALEALVAAELPASVSGALVRSTVSASLAFLGSEAATPALPALLARGVLHTMMIDRLKFGAAIVPAVVATAAGAGWVSYSARAGDPPTPATPPAAAKTQPPAKPNVPMAPRTPATPAQTLNSSKSGAPSEVIRSHFAKIISIDQPFDGELRDFIDYLTDRLGVTFIVDETAFRNTDPPLEHPQATKVKLPKLSGATLHAILQMLLDPIEGSYLIRDNCVVITTQKAVIQQLGYVEGTAAAAFGSQRAMAPSSLGEMTHLDVKATPFADAIRNLADTTGANILIDPRASEQAQKPVTAVLQHAPLRTAVRFLADMVGLKVVAQDTILYVTTPENAAKLAKEDAETQPKVK